MHILHLQEITCIQWSEWKYRTGRSIKLHPRRCWVALEVMSSVFPSWVLSQEMPCTSVCSRSKNMLSVLRFWRLELVPSSQVHQHSEYALFFFPQVCQQAVTKPSVQQEIHCWVEVSSSLTYLFPSIQNEVRSEHILPLLSTTYHFEQLSRFSDTRCVCFSISSMSARAQPIGKERYDMQIMKAESLLSSSLNVFWSSEKNNFFPQINKFIFF